jgi:hypothetical protein
MNDMTHPEVDISAPVPVEAPKLSFGRRLRTAIEALPEGEGITIRTKAERQYITNIVSAAQKKLGYRLTTKLLVRRDDDPENKIVIRISRIAGEEQAA